MSKKSSVTMADLGLTPGEAELFASGARHLFADPDHHPDEAPAQPVAKPAPKAQPKGALEDIAIGGGKKAGPKPVAKKSSSKPH